MPATHVYSLPGLLLARVVSVRLSNLHDEHRGRLGQAEMMMILLSIRATSACISTLASSLRLTSAGAEQRRESRQPSQLGSRRLDRRAGAPSTSSPSPDLQRRGKKRKEMHKKPAESACQGTTQPLRKDSGSWGLTNEDQLLYGREEGKESRPGSRGILMEFWALRLPLSLKPNNNRTTTKQPAVKDPLAE